MPCCSDSCDTVLIKDDHHAHRCSTNKGVKSGGTLSENALKTPFDGELVLPLSN